MITLKKVMVPTDFSDHSSKALRYGQELAAKFNAELHLFHAFESVPITYGEGGYIPLETSQEMEAAATKHLQELEVETDGSVKRVVNAGHPFVEIVRYAKENSIDLIVMGTHGRGAIAHMLLGSVADKVVRKAP